jgi:hypothetical protein
MADITNLRQKGASTLTAIGIDSGYQEAKDWMKSLLVDKTEDAKRDIEKVKIVTMPVI